MMPSKTSKGRTYGIVPTSQWRALRHHRGDLATLNLALWLRSCRHSTMLGLYHCPPGYAAAEIGLEVDEVLRSLTALGKTKDPREAPWQGASEAPSEALRVAHLGAFALWDETDELVWVVDMAQWEIGTSLKPKDHRFTAAERLLESLSGEFPGSPLPTAFRWYYSAFWGLPILGEGPLEGPGEGATQGAPKDLGKGQGKAHRKPLGKPASGSVGQQRADLRAARAREAEGDGEVLLAWAEPILRAWVETHHRACRLRPAELKQLEGWRDQGMPPTLVAQVIRDKGPGDVGSLRYYGEPDGGAAAAAWADQVSVQERLRAPATSVDPASLNIAGRLGRLAEVLTERGADEIAREIRTIDAKRPAAEVDEKLGELDAQMLAYAEEQLDEEGRGSLDAAVEAGLEALNGRVGDTAEMRRRTRVQLLRESAQLPALSLFSPDALEEVAHA